MAEDERFPTYDQLFEGWKQMQSERDRLRAKLTLVKDLLQEGSPREALRQLKLVLADSSPSETAAPIGLVREIHERHGRVSKLLWGGAPGVMLGPMDADAAHADRGTLLSLLTPAQRGAEETAAARVVNAAGTGAYDVPQIIETNEDGSPLKTTPEQT